MIYSRSKSFKLRKSRGKSLYDQVNRNTMKSISIKKGNTLYIDRKRKSFSFCIFEECGMRLWCHISGSHVACSNKLKFAIFVKMKNKFASFVQMKNKFLFEKLSENDWLLIIFILVKFILGKFQNLEKILSEIWFIIKHTWVLPETAP